ncbi:acyltransferase [Spongiactinospora sp. 9N601]|uniref:acyltransferase n=1 Tax=Spongiactinospora sp. 9N601 TaxID=3375149 RepID=UPI0037999BA8
MPDRIAGFAEKIAAATPDTRDRGVDALRALAIAGVVLGHWLVTAWATDQAGALRIASPLTAMPALAPMSWVLQTLAVFFFVGGYSAARGLRSAREGYLPWARRRLARLLAPVLPLAVFWAVLALALTSAGISRGTLRSFAVSALGPLWFLAVFTVLTLATPLLARVRPVAAAGGMAGVVVAVDVVRFGLAGPAWAGWANLAAGWLVPYLLGMAWAGGGLARRGTAVAMLTAGAAGTALLIAAFGYPASMVGVTGAAISNLGPPSLAGVCFGIAQTGAALLAHGPLTRLARRPRVWAAVAVANLSAMPVFLWHQTVLVVAAVTLLPFGRAAGLLDAPVSAQWLLWRAAWLPLFAAALAAAVLALRGRRFS